MKRIPHALPRLSALAVAVVVPAGLAGTARAGQVEGLPGWTSGGGAPRAARPRRPPP